MKIINDCNYPKAIIASMEEQQRKPHEDPKWISVTELIDSPQVRRLKRAHFDQLEVKASSLYASWRGTVIHEALAQHAGSGTAEKRLEVEISGWTLSGQPDHSEEVIDISEKGTLRDYKNVAMAGGFNGPKDEHKRQLNIYRWLIWKLTGVVLDRLVLNYFYQDWKLSESLRRLSYPPQHEEFVVPCWSFEETEEYVKARLLIHEDQNATCSPAERWQSDPVFAVMKKGSSRAVNGGKHDNRDAAEQMAHDLNKNATKDFILKGGLYIVEERPGEARRCQMYCSLLPFCQQGQAIVKDS